MIFTSDVLRELLLQNFLYQQLVGGGYVLSEKVTHIRNIAILTTMHAFAATLEEPARSAVMTAVNAAIKQSAENIA